MATQPIPRYTVEEYVSLENTLDYRSEYHDGYVFPVEAATPVHARLESRVASLFEKAFSPIGCSTFGPGLNLYIGSINKVLHPDATVVCGPLNCPKPDCVDNPYCSGRNHVPNKQGLRLRHKTRLLLRAAKSSHYLLVSQTAALVGHYQRSGEGWLYEDRGGDSMIYLGDVRIAVTELYEGAVLPPGIS